MLTMKQLHVGRNIRILQMMRETLVFLCLFWVLGFFSRFLVFRGFVFCFLGVLAVFGGRFVGVLWVFCGCFVGVLWVFCGFFVVFCCFLLFFVVFCCFLLFF